MLDLLQAACNPEHQIQFPPCARIFGNQCTQRRSSPLYPYLLPSSEVLSPFYAVPTAAGKPGLHASSVCFCKQQFCIDAMLTLSRLLAGRSEQSEVQPNGPSQAGEDESAASGQAAD